MSMSELRFEKLTAAIGHGTDLSTPIDSNLADERLEGLLNHQVLVFPGATIGPQTQIALAECVGPVWPRHPFFPSVEGAGRVAIIADGPESPPENAVWHSDMSATNPPPFVTVSRFEAAYSPRSTTPNPIGLLTAQNHASIV